jgi:hypothetical protein
MVAIYNGRTVSHADTPCPQRMSDKVQADHELWGIFSLCSPPVSSFVLLWPISFSEHQTSAASWLRALHFPEGCLGSHPHLHHLWDVFVAIGRRFVDSLKTLLRRRLLVLDRVCQASIFSKISSDDLDVEKDRLTRLLWLLFQALAAYLLPELYTFDSLLVAVKSLI